MFLLKKIFGSNEREVKKKLILVEKIKEVESSIIKLSDEELRAKTEYFKEKLRQGSTLEDILPESFAVVRETAFRVIKEKHYDVQLLGGITLHEGKIAEMKTGEGKTLTSTLPVYLNALSGRGAHVVTVNDYLAKRDCNWMGSVFDFLGLKTACIIHDASFMYEKRVLDKNEVTVEMENLQPISRREAYAADITYGTNNEFGFDYLRDNMVQSLEQMTQRELNFVIIDEVDSILIDEARTPLIISAPDTESTKLYEQFAKIVPRLEEKKHYEVDEKMRTVTLNEDGINKVEELLGIGNLYEAGKVSYVHNLEQSLKAHVLFKRDKDYVVNDGEVLIVDDFTGRLMHGRRYSDGLHQAIEAKEGVKVQRESKTLATVTFQNYFRMYKKISGMTGTAATSAEEFFKVYKLDVVEIPTNKPMKRKDLQDIIYKTEQGKFQAIAKEIKEINKTGRPILVGTIAIEKSEYLSALLEREGVRHQILNAKNHEKEATIIAMAGQKGSVTIATNMAGRGTDIKLGEGVRELGGLHIIGTERHEARRIDNQLRGRAGRQGDPGISQFYVSLEDELMRRFGGDKLKDTMTSLGLPEDQPIQNGLISRMIENAQSKIEGYNFDLRKHVLEYDDVINKQREVIYKKRKEILQNKNLKNEALRMTEEQLERVISLHCVGDESEWQKEEVFGEIMGIFSLNDEERKKAEAIIADKIKTAAEKRGSLIEFFMGLAKIHYAKKEAEMGEFARYAEKTVMLQSIDSLWMNHLDEIDYLRQGIGLRGYGQRDPLIEYKKEAYNLFTYLLENIRRTVVHSIFRVNLVVAPSNNPEAEKPKENIQYRDGEEVEQFGAVKKNDEQEKKPAIQTPIINKNKVGRNDPCPCGSGKKYKKCCGK